MVRTFEGPPAMYQLNCDTGEISLRQADGSGYLVRCCGGGNIETRVVCPSGDISDPVTRTPAEFLQHHPDAAEVPGIGAALFRLSCSNDVAETREAPDEIRPRRISNGHFKPVLRVIRP